MPNVQIPLGARLREPDELHLPELGLPIGRRLRAMHIGLHFLPVVDDLRDVRLVLRAIRTQHFVHALHARLRRLLRPGHLRDLPAPVPGDRPSFSRRRQLQRVSDRGVLEKRQLVLPVRHRQVRPVQELGHVLYRVQRRV